MPVAIGVINSKGCREKPLRCYALEDMNPKNGPLFLGIDVGTGSVRAAIFTQDGERLGRGEHNIRMRKRKPEHFEQSSDDVWSAVCKSVKNACNSTGIDGIGSKIVALGVDATCSLVAVDQNTFVPISVVQEGDQLDGDKGEVWNVILWLDHRALQETKDINRMTHIPAVNNVLRQFGNRISPENEPPKLLWLKRNIPSCITNGIFFDLADWVTFKCTGDAGIRSSCTVSCKWGWGASPNITNSPHFSGWDASFWEAIGLAELSANNFAKIGSKIQPPGYPAGILTADAARDLGLPMGCFVATGLVDAHCGAVGTLGARGDARADAFHLEQRLALACGTSTCHIALSQHPVFVPGVWGPFQRAVLPTHSLSEAGQSVSGALLTHIVRTHAAYPALRARVDSDKGVFDALNDMAQEVMRRGGTDPATHVHVLDSFAGNRSPFADPTFRGAVVGIGLEDDETALMAQYRAAMLALCYGARLILKRLNEAGHDLRAIFACGRAHKQ